MPFGGRTGLLIFFAGGFFVLAMSLIFPGLVTPESDHLPYPSTGDVSSSPSSVYSSIAVEAPADSILGRYDLRAVSAKTHKLPLDLIEISGLAMTGDDRLLAHNDETGTVYEVDYLSGKVIKSFRIAAGRNLLRGDFEGMAVAGSSIYLVTSNGTIYEFPEGKDREIVSSKAYPTPAGRDCEIEGLAYQPSNHSLLLTGKNPRSKRMREHVAVFQWSIDTRKIVDKATIMIPVKDFTRHIRSKHFQPSGIERHRESGHYFIVAARQHAVAEISLAGKVLDVRLLPGNLHRQAEGITFLSDQTLLISDEGKGKQARITLYPLIEPSAPVN